MRKRSRKQFLLCWPLLFITDSAFAGESATPARVVQEYLRVLSIARTAEVLAKYRSQRALNEENEFLQSLPPQRRDKYTNYLRLSLPAKNKPVSETVNGDTALVVIEKVGEEQMQPYQSKDHAVSVVIERYGSFFLKKETGNWKIDASSWNSDLARSPKENPVEFAAKAANAYKESFPNQPVQGKFLGSPFKPTTVIIGKDPAFGGTWLQFSQKTTGGNEDKLVLGLLDDVENVEARTFQIAMQKLSWNKRTMFNVRLESNKLPNYSVTHAGVSVAGMKLVFDKKTSAGLPGKIVLRLSSQPETSLSGNFVAVTRD